MKQDDDWQPLDKARWLHERDVPDDIEHDSADDLPIGAGKLRGEPRALQGHTAEETVKIARKGGKAARRNERLEKTRERLRSKGVTIHHDYRTWNKLGSDQQEAFQAAKREIPMRLLAAGTRYDFYRDFDDVDPLPLEGVEHLDYLFRSGTANPSPRRWVRDPLYWRSWETPPALQGKSIVDAYWKANPPERDWPSRETALAMIEAMRNPDHRWKDVEQSVPGADLYVADRCFMIFGYPELDPVAVSRWMAERSMMPTKSLEGRPSEVQQQTLSPLSPDQSFGFTPRR